ncbi:hypothetical protein AAL_00336 [Moelleriella libera RCEF 2490]|uniref:Uncharacterized protein n=1 Tax=Moelleriella libera RCEF 2490 TaxID=1081109 RepID=A0A166URI0_9HYPO|nr:hypothetical protein AAL_00336 [Moelleriella libera RCEF 2490]
MKSPVSCIFGRDSIVTWRSKNGKLPTTRSSMKRESEATRERDQKKLKAQLGNLSDALRERWHQLYVTVDELHNLRDEPRAAEERAKEAEDEMEELRAVDCRQPEDDPRGGSHGESARTMHNDIREALGMGCGQMLQERGVSQSIGDLLNSEAEKADVLQSINFMTDHGIIDQETATKAKSTVDKPPVEDTVPEVFQSVQDEISTALQSYKVTLSIEPKLPARIVVDFAAESAPANSQA